MAVIFELWAECNDEPSLLDLKAHFHDLHYTLTTGREIRFRADIENEDVRGLSVWSPHICSKGRGIETLQDALDATEGGIFLYHRLLTAPDFNFAHVGFEASRTNSQFLFESVYTMDNGERWVDMECVVNDQIYNKLGAPVSLRVFCKGYRWRWYKGETYQPLFGSDQMRLIEVSRKLLPYDLEPNSAWW